MPSIASRAALSRRATGARHNELRDRVADLAEKSFTPTHVCDNPIIFAGCDVKRPKGNTAGYKAKSKLSIPQQEAMEQKGELLIRDLWHNGTDSVHDMRVVNTDAKSHLAKTMEKCLQEA